MNACTVVEFGTSFRISTIYLAAAVRDNGGNKVTSTELVPEQAERAHQHIAEAGLSDCVEIRVGDALQTLKCLEGEVDFMLNELLGNLRTAITAQVPSCNRTTS